MGKMYNAKKYEKSPVSNDTGLFVWCCQRESNPHSIATEGF